MKAMTLLLALALACATGAALAQTSTPAKPAPKPAAAAKLAPPASSAGKTAGGTDTSSPILTRDELRRCLAQEEAIRGALSEIEARRAPLDKENAELSARQETLRAERGGLDDARKQADDLVARMKDYAARVASWNDRVSALNEKAPVGPKGDRERAALTKERDELGVEQKALEGEKAAVNQANESSVQAFNQKATELDVSVVSWNRRNEEWNQDSRDLERERSGWVKNCSQRRYREDDEIAIKRGK